MSPRRDVIAERAEWLRGYAKKKPVRRFNGNFWGISRTRCLILRPEEIQELVSRGFITLQSFPPPYQNSDSFTVNPRAPSREGERA